MYAHRCRLSIKCTVQFSCIGLRLQLESLQTSSSLSLRFIAFMLRIEIKTSRKTNWSAHPAFAVHSASGRPLNTAGEADAALATAAETAASKGPSQGRQERCRGGPWWNWNTDHLTLAFEGTALTVNGRATYTKPIAGAVCFPIVFLVARDSAGCSGHVSAGAPTDETSETLRPPWCSWCFQESKKSTRNVRCEAVHTTFENRGLLPFRHPAAIRDPLEKPSLPSRFTSAVFDQIRNTSRCKCPTYK